MAAISSSSRHLAHHQQQHNPRVMRPPAPAHRLQHPQPPAALWGNLGGLFGGGSSSSAQQPRVRPADMLDLGGLTVSPMGLGTWAWGNQLLWGYDPAMDAELQEVFNLVVDAGVNIFDTADSYGTGKLNGRSEQLLGRFIREYPGSSAAGGSKNGRSSSRSSKQPRGPPGGLHVATKFAAYPWRVTPGNIVAACRGSLRRTGLERISLGQLHWSTAKYQPLQEWALWNGLADCYEQGLVAAVGVSNYGARELVRVARDFERRGVPLASAQVQFSLLSAGSAQAGVKAVADDLGITLIAYSPLCLGLLSGKYTAGGALPPGPRAGLFKSLLPGVAPVLETLGAVADERGRSMSQVAIAWCMAKGTLPIPGAKDLAQARDNLGALSVRLDGGEVAELDAAVARCTKTALQNIFQTA